MVPVWGANGCGAGITALPHPHGNCPALFIKDLKGNSVLMLEGILLKDVFPARSKN